MAVRRTTRSRRVKRPEVVSVAPVVGVELVKPKRKWKGWAALAIALGLLGLWWWRTNSWPVIAFVGLKPVTRYEVNKTLYAQGGEALVDNIITQRLVDEELSRMGVTADPAKVNEQLEKMKQGLPEGAKWEEELVARGITEKQIRDLVGLQLRLTTAVEKDATVSASEIADYIKQNGTYMTGKTDAEKQTEAQGLLAQSKQGTAIEAFIAKVKEAGLARVWRLPVWK